VHCPVFTNQSLWKLRFFDKSNLVILRLVVPGKPASRMRTDMDVIVLTSAGLSSFHRNNKVEQSKLFVIVF
jgi:hypothetical protein